MNYSGWRCFYLITFIFYVRKIFANDVSVNVIIPPETHVDEACIIKNSNFTCDPPDDSYKGECCVGGKCVWYIESEGPPRKFNKHCVEDDEYVGPWTGDCVMKDDSCLYKPCCETLKCVGPRQAKICTSLWEKTFEYKDPIEGPR